MKRFLSNVLFIAVLVIAALGVFANERALAQADATPEATAVAPNVTVINEAPATAPVDTNALAQFGLYALLALIGGGSFALVLTRLDKRGLDALEKAYQSTSPETQAVILEVVKTLAAVVKVAQEVTDGQSNDAPPTGGN